MRWPFVSRETLDMAERRRVDTADALKRAEDRFAALLVQYHELATTKSAAPVPPFAPPPDFKDFPPLVAGALAIATAGLPRDVVRAARTRARAMLDEGGKVEDVATAVRRGERSPDSRMAD